MTAVVGKPEAVAAIDQLLKAVRATSPSVPTIDSAITGFRDVVSAIDQKQ